MVSYVCVYINMYIHALGYVNKLLIFFSNFCKIRASVMFDVQLRKFVHKMRLLGISSIFRTGTK